MLVLAVVGWLALEEPGFGGAPEESASAADSAADSPPASPPDSPHDSRRDAPPESPPDDGCVIRGDDGVWRTCAEVLANKKKATAPVDEPAPPDPEQEKLREAFKKSAAAAPKKTKLELDYEKANLDLTLPLLSLRISVARLEDELKEMSERGAPPARTQPVERTYTREKEALEIVEGIAITRLLDCARRIGKPITVKNYKMTPGGPVYLSRMEVLQQLPSTDPFGCGRNEMIDRGTVERARRMSDIRATLEENNFGFHDVGKRKELERELKELEDDLEAQSLPGLGPKTRPKKKKR